MRSTFLLIIGITITSFCSAQDSNDFYLKGYEYMYSNKDSSYYYFDKALKNYEAAQDADNQFTSLVGVLYANGYYYDLSSLKKNLNKLEKLIYSTAYKDSDYKDYLVDRLYLEKINYYFKLSNYVATQQYLDSLSSFQKSRALIKRDLDYYETTLSAGLYQGSIYKNQGKLNLALEKYKQLEGFLTEHADSLTDSRNSAFSIKRLQAKTYASLGEIDSAILTQIQALDIIEDDRSYANSRLDIELDLTANLITTNELGDATDLIKIIEAGSINKGLFKTRLLTHKIDLARLQKDDKGNRKFHREKLKEITKYRETERHPEVIGAYMNYAADELHWGAIDSAFAKLKKASSLLPPTNEIDASFTLSKLRLELASQYLKTYQATTNFSTNANDMLAKIGDIITFLDILQPQFESKLDKQYLINSAYPALQNAFSLLYELHKNTGEFRFLDVAFTISEKSKAIELRAIRQAGLAQQTLNTDPKIIETENLYNYRINQLEKDLFTATESNEKLQDSLLAQKEAYGDFVAELRDKNPEYYNLRYSNNITSLAQRIDDQAKNTATISFFLAGETMYAFSITKENTEIISIPYTQNDQEDIRTYYELISKVNIQDRDDLEQLSHQLYTKYITSIFLEKIPESLTIIPDGLLHYIPFEALQKDDTFLIEKTIVSYKPSVSFMQELPSGRDNSVGFFGFAPTFDKTGDLGLSPLSFNQEEVKLANSYYDGVTYMGEEGTLVRFRESVKNNSSLSKLPIYHLATHAITNDTLPEYSYLAFTPKADKDDYILYAKDLYTEQLNGAMVVLSACETGLGKLENGQGMQSLAQGFYYGGASSLVSSKWKVSDRYTADLMNLFYKNLEEGHPKDKALQQAKITYLKSLDDPNLAHPFYWASFVFSGDTTPLPNNPTAVWIWLGSALILIGLTGFWLFRKRKAQHS